MMPSLSSLSSSSSSSSSASVRVEKATSEFLIGPDWTMNMDICDAVNSDHWLAKDVIRAVKKRLLHKNPKVQLLALTLLETMVKNCGDYVHLQVAERNILQEMIKIVRKKSDIHVRDKILVLLDSWQEAFGGPGGRHSQYYWAYEELRRSGVSFPRRSPNSAPIFTPPATHSTGNHTQAGYGMPSNSSTRLDEVMAADIGNLSSSSIGSMRNALDLLADMLQAINPSDRMAVKDELIVDLVNQCRSNQKKLMHMLTTTTNEELLALGLELNDSLQSLLAKHDAIASGSPLPVPVENAGTQPVQEVAPDQHATEVVAKSSTLAVNSSAPTVGKGVQEEEEEDDDFAQLARRHSKTRTIVSGSMPLGNNEGVLSVNASSSSSASTNLPPVMGNELALCDPPAPARGKEQDMIDLLSLTLSTSTVSPSTPHTSAAAMPNTQLPPVSSTTEGYSTPNMYSVNQGQASSSSYVVPWAQPQPQQTSQPETFPQPRGITHPQYISQNQQQQQPHLQYADSFGTLPQHQRQPHQFQPYFQSQPPNQQLPFQTQPQPQPYSQHQQYRHHLQSRQQPQPQSQPHVSQYSSAYPPPPWAPTPGYLRNANSASPSPYAYSTPQPYTSSPLQNADLIPTSSSSESAIRRDAQPSSGQGTTAGVQKPFIPSYRLFEDLNVLGNTDGRYRTTSNASPSLAGGNYPTMIGGRK